MEEDWQAVVENVIVRPRNHTTACRLKWSLQEAATILDISTDLSSTTFAPNLTTLILLAHSPALVPQPTPLLITLYPLMLSSLQTNAASDESLSLLLVLLSSPLSTASSPTTSSRTLPPDLVMALSSVLPTVASTHPDPTTRHIALHVLRLLLTHAPSQVHFQIVGELLSSSPPPMRVAAINLVKEAVLRALEDPSESIWASEEVLRVFGGVLFRPESLDISEGELSETEGGNEWEWKRLTECLSLVYVLLLRDARNRVRLNPLHSSYAWMPQTVVLSN